MVHHTPFSHLWLGLLLFFFFPLGKMTQASEDFSSLEESLELSISPETMAFFGLTDDLAFSPDYLKSEVIALFNDEHTLFGTFGQVFSMVKNEYISIGMWALPLMAVAQIQVWADDDLFLQKYFPKEQELYAYLLKNIHLTEQIVQNVPNRDNRIYPEIWKNKVLSGIKDIKPLNMVLYSFLKSFPYLKCYDALLSIFIPLLMGYKGKCAYIALLSHFIQSFLKLTEEKNLDTIVISTYSKVENDKKKAGYRLVSIYARLHACIPKFISYIPLFLMIFFITIRVATPEKCFDPYKASELVRDKWGDSLGLLIGFEVIVPVVWRYCIDSYFLTLAKKTSISWFILSLYHIFKYLILETLYYYLLTKIR